MAKKKEETALAPIEERYLSFDEDFEIGELVAETFSAGENVKRSSLPRVPFPAAGATAWETGDGPAVELRGVIVHQHAERRYYENPFSETKGKEPALCRSSDGLVGIGEPGGSCLTCKIKEWREDGESMEDRKPLCQERMAFYMLLEGEVLPTRISLPPTSLSLWQEFRVQKLLNRGLSLKSVELSLTLDKDENDQGVFSTLVPEVASVLSKEQRAALREYAKGVMPMIVQDAADAAEEDAAAA